MSKQAEGGKARAAKLSPEERSAIAKHGAQVRWRRAGIEGLPKATHSGTLSIGDKSFGCAVLEDGTRVISETQFMAGMGIYRSGALSTRRPDDPDGARLPLHLAFKNLAPFIDDELAGALSSPKLYIAERGRTIGHGIPADMIPKICEVWLRARDAGVLKPTQLKIAAVADALVRALAQVAIVALIDEATGYQAERDKAELQMLLSKYLTQERLKWVSTFPQEFFNQIHRLNNWKKPVGNARTPYIGRIINKIVYERLPKGVLEELRKRNPVDYQTKRRKWTHHQFLSDDLGHPDLRAHLQQLVVLMRISRDWQQFIQFFGQAFMPETSGTQQELGLEMD